MFKALNMPRQSFLLSSKQFKEIHCFFQWKLGRNNARNYAQPGAIMRNPAQFQNVCFLDCNFCVGKAVNSDQSDQIYRFRSGILAEIRTSLHDWSLKLFELTCWRDACDQVWRSQPFPKDWVGGNLKGTLNALAKIMIKIIRVELLCFRVYHI